MTCPICVSNLNSTNCVHLIGCRHAFCCPCITQWYSIGKNCPTCKQVPTGYFFPSNPKETFLFKYSESKSKTKQIALRRSCSLCHEAGYETAMKPCFQCNKMWHKRCALDSFPDKDSFTCLMCLSHRHTKTEREKRRTKRSLPSLSLKSTTPRKEQKRNPKPKPKPKPKPARTERELIGKVAHIPLESAFWEKGNTMESKIRFFVWTRLKELQHGEERKVLSFLTQELRYTIGKDPVYCKRRVSSTFALSHVKGFFCQSHLAPLPHVKVWTRNRDRLFQVVRQ